MINLFSLKYLYTTIKLFATAAVVVLYIHYFFPQSWGFYTIESNIPIFNIYRIKNGVPDKSSLITTNMSYGMGISRKGKILFNDLYSIVDNNTLSWKLLNKDSLNYITEHGFYNLISKGSDNGSLKGSFIITKTYRPSYSDLKKSNFFHPMEEYALVDVR